MATNPLPEPEQLRQILRYEPDTGKLFWLTRTPDMFPEGKHSAAHTCAKWNGAFAGQQALNADKGNGYRYGTVLYRNMLAHRVAWALYYGAWPEDMLDHINGNRSDNRIENLRQATNTQNQFNRKPAAASRSGLKGVSLHRSSGLWHAVLRADGKTHSLGYHKTPELAHAAYSKASQRLHGEFSRTK